MNKIIAVTVLSMLFASCKATTEPQGKTMKYQLRYATIEIPNDMTIHSDFSYAINTDIPNTEIEFITVGKAMEYIHPRIASIYKDLNPYSEAVIEESEKEELIINGNKAYCMRIEYQRTEKFSMKYVEYVCIEGENGFVVFTLYGFLSRLEEKKSLWKSMYESFRFDSSQTYKLPFGSFTMPSEAVIDDSSFYIRFPTEEIKYTIEIDYVEDIEFAKDAIKEFKPNILSFLMGAIVWVKHDTRMNIDNKKARYFESEINFKGKKSSLAVFHILQDIKPGLQIMITAEDDSEVFNEYRPQMDAMLKSIVFEKEL